MRFLGLLIACAACVQACDTSSSDGSPATSGGASGATPGVPSTAGTLAPNLNAGAGGAGAPAMNPAGAAGTGGVGAGAAGAGGTAGASGTGGAGGASGAGGAGTGGGSAPDAGQTPNDDAAIDGGGGFGADPIEFAAGLHELFIHDACTGEYAPQPDTCLHELRVEREVVFGGETGTVYDVTLRVRGLFEPTTISGGQTPLPQHPYYKVGGTVAAQDYSHWHIEVSNPRQTYWLNHYPSTSHTIYAEDFQATIPIAAGADVAVRVIDGNDREIDNAEQGLPDRRQLIEGVTDEVLDGQVLRLDVVSVEAR